MKKKFVPGPCIAQCFFSHRLPAGWPPSAFFLCAAPASWQPVSLCEKNIYFNSISTCNVITNQKLRSKPHLKEWFICKKLGQNQHGTSSGKGFGSRIQQDFDFCQIRSSPSNMQRYSVAQTPECQVRGFLLEHMMSCCLKAWGHQVGSGEIIEFCFAIQNLGWTSTK